VILVDANLLVYAHVADLLQHEAAREWLDERLARVFPSPLLASEAMAQVSDWLSRPAAWCPGPTERHDDLLGDLLEADGIRADLVPDAHLAAIAIGHGLTLMSNDSDFARFSGLSWENPLDA
jgi:predicted nucleic acid-binding protein